VGSANWRRGGEGRSTVDAGTILLLALVLVCPLTMLWMMRGHRRRARDTHPGEHGAKAGSSVPPARVEELERHEPPYTRSDRIVSPKFGAGGSGGAEHERGPETHDR
jgi:hypothetical protein